MIRRYCTGIYMDSADSYHLYVCDDYGTLVSVEWSLGAIHNAYIT